MRISFVSTVFLFCFSGCETVTSPGAQNRGSSAVYKSLLCSPPSVPSFMPVRGTAPLPVSVPMLSIHEGTASWEIGKQAKTDAIAQALLSPLSQQRSSLSLSRWGPPSQSSLLLFFLPRAETTWYHKVINGYQIRVYE